MLTSYIVIFLLIILVVIILFSWVTVNPQEEKILLYWGSLSEVIKTPGLHFRLFLGRSCIDVSTKITTIELNRTTVADANGNPIIIAGICTFQVVDSIKAAFEVENYTEYVKTQAMAVLKQVASRYPYEHKEQPSLKG